MMTLMIKRPAAIVLCVLSTVLLPMLELAQGKMSDNNQSEEPLAVDSLLRQAKEAEERGSFSQAADYYLQYLKIHPRSASVLQRLGLDYYLSNRFDDAVPTFIQALSLDQNLWGSALFLGISYYRLGQFEKALAPLNESLQLKPDLDEAHFWLGCSLLGLGRAEEAISELRRVPNGSALTLQAESMLVRAYRNAAEEHYQKIGAAGPDSYRGHQLQAELSVWEGRVTKAVVEYREALKQKPDLEGAHRAIADLYWQGGMLDLAEKEYEEELRWHPLDGESRLRLGLYWLTAVQNN
jgi:tetratricopeptide (TPR) repeat protein